MQNNRIIALVDMNAFLASVEQALNPDLAGSPVIVGGEPGTRGVVICASYEARRLGVGFGMSLAEAYRRLPHAHFVKGDIKIYLDYWRKVQEIFDQYTPQVEPVSMDEGYLDLRAAANRFRIGARAGPVLKDEIKGRLSLRCSVGISTSKMFAKIACNMRKARWPHRHQRDARPGDAAVPAGAPDSEYRPQDREDAGRAWRA